MQKISSTSLRTGFESNHPDELVKLKYLRVYDKSDELTRGLVAELVAIDVLDRNKCKL